MLNKTGVILVMFDIPGTSREEKKAYRKFVKSLKDNGYVMFQESIYLKLVRNLTNVEGEIRKLNTPEANTADISILPLKVKNFLAIRTIKGPGYDLELLTGNLVNV